MADLGVVPCAMCGAVRHVVARGPLSLVGSETAYVQVDVNPCPECGFDSGSADARRRAQSLLREPPDGTAS